MSTQQSFTRKVVAALSNLPQSKSVSTAVARGGDFALAIPGLVRAPFIVTQYFMHKGPLLVVAETPEHAEKLIVQLSAYLDAEQLLALPVRSDEPWRDKAPDAEEIVTRAQALWALQTAQRVLVVTCVQALMRTILPPTAMAYQPLEFAVGSEHDLGEVTNRLAQMGYTRVESVDGEGTFSVRGDIVDIYPPLGTPSVRIDFFGDEVEMIRRFVPGTGQVISEISEVSIFPIREFYLTEESKQRGFDALVKQAFLSADVAHHRELIAQGVLFNGIERYLPLLHPKTVSPAVYMPASGVTVIAEPKVLFDCAVKEYACLETQADKAEFTGVVKKGSPLEGIYATPAQLDFGPAPRLTLLTLAKVGGVDATIKARRPEVSGSDVRLVAGVQSLIESGFSVTLALPNRRQRERVTDLMIDEHVPLGDGRKMLQMSDVDVVSGFVVPEAKIAVISTHDAFPRSTSSKQKRRTVDPTKLTFAFQPGDYVVHASYGIALFKEVTRREVDGVSRDYLRLEYADGDALYTPIDQIDKITKYVGAEGSTPKITRLGGSRWAKATATARAAAKKLAFDLVNLYARRSQVHGYQYGPDTQAQIEMEAAFPYEETPDQQEAIADVKDDMESDKPMDRLVCGDVGYGKTEVAIRAAFKAVQDGKQVMVLCPTTILTQQHYTNFDDRFRPFGVHVEVLSRFRTPAQQRLALEGFEKGTVQVLIGTHRLLSKDIVPKDLGLLIIDEEQRFGVEHKEHLKNMREQIDVLALSATPIPRTLQMSLSGVRDMSIIDTAPANRHPIRVHVGVWDEEIVAIAIRSELERKGQVYYVSNRVRTIDEAVARVLDVAPEARVGVAHGQMSEHELEEVMELFAAQEIDVLVATTIIESGIDNPHSNTLIIEDSQRLGLAQLYQLKGRVGRSHVHAYAYFLYPSETELTPQAVERLMAIAEHDDLGSGIKIAMRDLEIRGAGSLIGGEQSGQLSAVGFDLFASMIAEAISEARGETVVAFPEMRIELDVPAYINDDYVTDIAARLIIYRRVAALTTPEAVASLLGEVVDTYGEMPEETANLFGLARIKVLAAEIGAKAVARSGGYITIKMTRVEPELREELKMIHALFDERSRTVKWKIPYGDTVVKAASTLLGAIVFDGS